MRWLFINGGMTPVMSSSPSFQNFQSSKWLWLFKTAIRGNKRKVKKARRSSLKIRGGSFFRRRKFCWDYLVASRSFACTVLTVQQYIEETRLELCFQSFLLSLLAVRYLFHSTLTWLFLFLFVSENSKVFVFVTGKVQRYDCVVKSRFWKGTTHTETRPVFIL